MAKRRNSKRRRTSLFGAATTARCHYCGRLMDVDGLVAEHMVPLCRGGSNHASNLVPACRPCDHLKGPLTADEFLTVRGTARLRKQLISAVYRAMRDEQGSDA